MRHKCGGCDATWTGLKMCHCSACHRLFTTPANFDRHQVGTADNPRCEIDPKKLVELRPGVFGQPGPESGSESYRLSGNEAS